MIPALLSDPEIWIGFLTLTALEVVLGIDNLVFLSVVSARLPEDQRRRAQVMGLAGALVMRVLLLFSLVWITKLTTPVFSVMNFDVSWRDLILAGGGVFLLAKGTVEIHHTVEGADAAPAGETAGASFAIAIGQIMLLDLVFSLDSVITAVGMVQNIWVMVAAVCVAILVMLFAAGPVGGFVERHPTTKMLALSFLLLVGAALVADGLHFHIPRGYLYFAIGFSLAVEALNLLVKRRRRRQRAGAA